MTRHTHVDTPTRFADADGIRYAYHRFGNGYEFPNVEQPLRHPDQRIEDRTFTPPAQMSAGQLTLAEHGYLAMAFHRHRLMLGMARLNRMDDQAIANLA